MSELRDALAATGADKSVMEVKQLICVAKDLKIGEAELEELGDSDYMMKVNLFEFHQVMKAAAKIA